MPMTDPRPDVTSRNEAAEDLSLAVADLKAQNAVLRFRYAEAIDALESVIAQRDEAERAKASAIITLHRQSETLVWRAGGVFRRFGRRFPCIAAYCDALIRLGVAILRGRRQAFLERRKRSRSLLDEDRAIIQSTSLFESDWYLAAYPDVKTSAYAPIDHYLRFGAIEGRRPNPAFDPVWYLASYPDARQSRHDPLAHYISEGAARNYRPNASFDPSWYAHRHRMTMPPGQSALEHYRRNGGGAIAAEPSEAVLTGLA